MKKLIYGICFVLVVTITSVCVSGNTYAINIDGTFDMAEWSGNYADGDGIIGPGGGGQAFDVEYLGLEIENPGSMHFGLQTGFDVRTSTSGWASGDFAINVDGDAFYEYGIRFIDLDNNLANGSAVEFELYEVGTWVDVGIPAHAASNPWRIDTNDATLVSTSTGKFGFGDDLANNINGGRSYILEGAFDFSALALYSGGPVSIQWTMGCGNDNLNFTTDTAPVPEPTTIALLGIGLTGLAGAKLRRRRKKRAVDKS